MKNMKNMVEAIVMARDGVDACTASTAWLCATCHQNYCVITSIPRRISLIHFDDNGSEEWLRNPNDIKCEMYLKFIGCQWSAVSGQRCAAVYVWDSGRSWLRLTDTIWSSNCLVRQGLGGEAAEGRDSKQHHWLIVYLIHSYCSHNMKRSYGFPLITRSELTKYSPMQKFWAQRKMKNDNIFRNSPGYLRDLYFCFNWKDIVKKSYFVNGKSNRKGKIKLNGH